MQTTAPSTFQATYRPWLHRYTMLLVAATFVLVTLGGHVTSKDAGLAVPDGFTVYGHFLWSFPYEKWVGNIWYEHVHRLKGSVVGIMAIILAVWFWKSQKGRRWLQLWGVMILLLVIAQGIMGALRVDFARWFPPLATPFAVVHAVVGQVFLCVTVIAAAATSRWWINQNRDDFSLKSAAQSPTLSVTTPPSPPLYPPPTPYHPTINSHLPKSAHWLAWSLVVVLLVQLTLGALMRHNSAGLAIPDFPASYGQLVPPLNQPDIIAAIDARPMDEFIDYFTPFQVGIHFAHRAFAMVVVIAAVLVIARLSRMSRQSPALVRPMLWIIALLAAQVFLGALTVWFRRDPTIATSHQAMGAAILALATLLAARVHLLHWSGLDRGLANDASRPHRADTTTSLPSNLPQASPA